MITADETRRRAEECRGAAFDEQIAGASHVSTVKRRLELLEAALLAAIDEVADPYHEG